METPTLPATLVFYTVSHPDGGWCALDGCTEPFVTFCQPRAEELVAKVPGARVVAHEYTRRRGVLAWLRGAA